MSPVRKGTLRAARVVLSIESLAGGFPGSVDAMRQYLQSPALARRVPEEVREAFLASEPFEAAEEPLGSIVKTGFRLNAAGQPWIGAWQVKACLQQAALATYTTKSSPSIYTMKRAITYNLEILPHEVVLLNPTPMHGVEIQQIIAHPRNPSIKVPSVRQRQVIDAARVEFNVICLLVGAGSELEDELENLLRNAGPFVGLGTDRGYGHGRFQVVRFAWNESALSPGSVEVPDEPDRKGITYERKQTKKSELQ